MYSQFLKKCTCFVLNICALSFAVTYYVSPDGNDTNDWSESSPFKTLHHTRDALRSISGEAKTVIIKGGNYFLNEPLRFEEQDGGTEQYPVIWQGAEGEWPVIYGGPRLTGWEKVKDIEGTIRYKMLE